MEKTTNDNGCRCAALHAIHVHARHLGANPGPTMSVFARPQRSPPMRALQNVGPRTRKENTHSAIDPSRNAPTSVPRAPSARAWWRQLAEGRVLLVITGLILTQIQARPIRGAVLRCWFADAAHQ
jgi:hypothetical protein